MTGHTARRKERLVLIMKKTYKIEVDCANCAQKMEDAANTVSGMENVLSACKKVEDDCEIFDI